jgi:hypothetical protein
VEELTLPALPVELAPPVVEEEAVEEEYDGVCPVLDW